MDGATAAAEVVRGVSAVSSGEAPAALEVVKRRETRDELEALGDEIAELAAHIEVARARLLRLIQRFDAAEGWVAAGARSCAEWLSWRIGLGPVAARDKVRVARALLSLPRLSAAFARGELSYSKLRAVTRVATVDNEELLLSYAQHGSAAQVERIVRSYRFVLGAQAAERDVARHEARGLRWRVDSDGMLVIEGRLAPEQGAVLLRALERAEAELLTGGRSDLEGAPDDSAEAPPTRPGEAEPETAAQRRADALTLVAQSALDHALRRGTAADQTQIVLHVDAEALADPDAPGRCAIDEVGDVSAQAARRLACDASVVTVVHGTDGCVLDVGRKTRSIPPAIRRALAARDSDCQFPGCDCRRQLQAHHVRHWAAGGATCLQNLLSLCAFHHRLLHEGGFSVTRDRASGALVFRRPDGRAVSATPPPVPLPAQPLRALVATHRRLGLQLSSKTLALAQHPGAPDYGWAVDLLLARQATGPAPD
jgi:hypothetical protein